MNSDRFLDLIEHPEFAREADVQGLEQLIQQYPYFSMAYMLLTKISAENNPSSANPYLQNALMVVPDQELFFDFLKKKETRLSEGEWMVSAASGSDIGLNSVSIAEEFNEEQSVEKDAGEGEATAVLEEQLQENIFEQENAEFDLWNKSGGTGSENAPVHDPIEEQDEEHLAVEEDPEIISSTVLEEEFVLLEKDSWMKDEKKSEEEVLQVENHQTIPSAESITEEAATEENTVSFLPDKKTSFVGWLQFFKKNKKAPQAPFKAKKEKQREEQSEIPSAVADEHHEANFMKEELEHIDKIVSEIKTGNFYKPSAENISAMDLAKKSMELGEEVISETLAQIYEEQGIYDKAIRMYARLSLKYPEKMATFASRIKALKKKKSNSD